MSQQPTEQTGPYQQPPTAYPPFQPYQPPPGYQPWTPYQQPPPSYYPPPQGYIPGPVSPTSRPVRQNVKIAALVIWAAAVILVLGGGLQYVQIAGLLNLAVFILIFFI